MKTTNHKRTNILLRALLLCLCAALLAGTAFAESAEILDLGREGMDILFYETTLADGRILLRGFTAAPGMGEEETSARLLCLNRDRTVSWEYTDEACNGGRFDHAAELADGTIGVTFQRWQENGYGDTTLRFFTPDGKPTGKEVSLPVNGHTYIQNATASRLQMIHDITLTTASEGVYESHRYENYLIDWDGKEIARNDDFFIHFSYCSMIEEPDGLVMTGEALDDKYFMGTIPQIVKTDFQGNVLWKTDLPCIWPDTSWATPQFTIRTEDGGYLILQTETVPTGEDWKYLTRKALIRLDNNGEILWTCTEGFRDETEVCNGMAMVGGKIAALFVSYDSDVPAKSYLLDKHRIIRWFDGNGKFLGITQLNLRPEYFEQLMQDARQRDEDGEWSPRLYCNAMIPMQDGFWMSANFDLWEEETNTRDTDSYEAFLIKVPGS